MRCTPVRQPNEWLISCKRPHTNLRSIVAAGRVGHGRSPAPPAFVGCISGLDRGKRRKLTGGYPLNPSKKEGQPRTRCESEPARGDCGAQEFSERLEVRPAVATI